MALDPETTQNAGYAGWAVFGTGTLALIISMVRKVVRGLSSDSVGLKQDAAQKETLDQMQSEIERLEKLVIRMQKKMAAMEARMAKSGQALIEAQMILIDVERAMVSCDFDCGNNLNVRVKLNEAQDLLAKASQEAAKPIIIEEDV